jgi:hypothetical protein
MDRIKFVPKGEMGTREWFAAHLDEFGMSIINSATAFPDCIVETDDGEVLRAEMEYKSGNFIAHKHEPSGCDIVICWLHDSELPLPVLELSTKKCYAPNERNEPVFGKGKQRKMSDERKRGRQAKEVVIETEEYATFVECYVRDLMAQSKYSKDLIAPRLILLKATEVLLRLLREGGIDFGDLHPSDLMRLLSY